MATTQENDPFAVFAAWYLEARQSESAEPNAMTVATADAGGRPSARIVLLKEFDARGFVFYTNQESRKGMDLHVNPVAALCFHWKTLARQVRIEGAVSVVDGAAADSYFASRARISQIGAWASAQSRPLASRSDLMALVRKFEEEFAGRDVPRPPHWGGVRVTPLRIEFWQEGSYRLHDRRLFSRAGESQDWTINRLHP